MLVSTGIRHIAFVPLQYGRKLDRSGGFCIRWCKTCPQSLQDQELYNCGTVSMRFNGTGFPYFFSSKPCVWRLVKVTEMPRETKLTYLVDEGSDDPQTGEFSGEGPDTFWAGNEVEEKNVILGYTPRLEDLDCHGGRST